jgi:hypothetical protein
LIAEQKLHPPSCDVVPEGCEEIAADENPPGDILIMGRLRIDY